MTDMVKKVKIKVISKTHVMLFEKEVFLTNNFQLITASSPSLGIKN